MEEYYTPALEEFHVGFEIELYNADGGCWGKYIVTEGDRPIDFVNDIESDCCRVKYLDKQDIESLEWKILTTFKSPFTGRQGYTFGISNSRGFNEGADYKLITLDNHVYQIHIIHYSHYEYKQETMAFSIRNKSELKKLMLHLHISLNGRSKN